LNVKLKMTDGDERFQRGANKYAAYLETPEGRLRLDLAFANLQDFLPSGGDASLCALDLGGGTGATAVRLAQRGMRVTIVDSSAVMLDLAKLAIEAAGVIDKVELKQGDVTQMTDLFPTRSFDAVLCHNLLEYCDDPEAVIGGAAHIMRNSAAILSVLVRNQAGEVLKSAIQSGDLVAAENGVTAEWGQESLYGGKVRLFRPDNLQRMLKSASLDIVAERGVRVITDYLPNTIDRSANYDRILELERKLGTRPDFASVARYTQCLARRPDQ